MRDREVMYGRILMTTKPRNDSEQCAFRVEMKKWGLKAPTSKMVAKLTRVPQPSGLSRHDEQEGRDREWKWPIARMSVIVPAAVKLHGSGMDAVKAVEDAFAGSDGKDLAWVQAKLTRAAQQAA